MPVFHDVVKHKFPLMMLIIILSPTFGPRHWSRKQESRRLAAQTEVRDTEAEVGKCTSSTTSLGEHPFSDVVSSGTALNTGADVLNADVGVEGLELLMVGSYQSCYSSDGNFSSDSNSDRVGMYDVCEALNCLVVRSYYCYSERVSHGRGLHWHSGQSLLIEPVCC